MIALLCILRVGVAPSLITEMLVRKELQVLYCLTDGHDLSAGERALGNWGKVMVEIMIIVSQIGT